MRPREDCTWRAGGGSCTGGGGGAKREGRGYGACRGGGTGGRAGSEAGADSRELRGRDCGSAVAEMHDSCSRERWPHPLVIISVRVRVDVGRMYLSHKRGVLEYLLPGTPAAAPPRLRPPAPRGARGPPAPAPARRGRGARGPAAAPPTCLGVGAAPGETLEEQRRRENAG